MGDQNCADLLSIPQGGGAVRSIGETFQPDPQTGTGRLIVPIDLPPGRGVLTPNIHLAYSSGAGNGPFGLGWQLFVPAIARRTDKQIPRYDDSDVFLLSGAEYLVPVRGAATAKVQRYRPQAETLFARIEHHTSGGDYWIAWSKDGLRSTYGTPQPQPTPDGWKDPAVIADPAGNGHVFSWLLTATEDTFGNTISYGYAPDPADPPGAQRYLTSIGYADYTAAAGQHDLIQIRFAYQPRPDRHTDRRPGFPLSTGQRCTTIETWIGTGTAAKVKAVELAYSDADTRAADNGVSLLTTISVLGFDATGSESLPPLELGYSSWDPARRHYQSVDTGGSPPPSLTDRTLDLVDLFGVGLPDVLQLAGNVSRYWRNTGNAHFRQPCTLTAAPPASLGSDGVQLADADGDGRPDLLITDRTLHGYFPISANGEFDPRGYVGYQSAPAFSLTDPQTRLIDLTGDGVADALNIGGGSLQMYFNQRQLGWSAQPVTAASPLDSVSFADPRIKLADMSGDGLTDIVLVANGRIQYWPNLGYGHFGTAITMRDSPQYGDASLYGTAGYDPARLLLGDVDGDGCADIVYVGSTATTVWINQAGQRFAPAFTVRGTPSVDAATAVRLSDLLGSGTNGILWTYDRRPEGQSGYRFLDLTGGTKPYLLTNIDNHMGGHTRISYAPSTQYALADAAAGSPWRTTLPFPVQVVATITATEHFSASTASCVYRYHHGYWDGADREFRGFARVDCDDTTDFDPQSGLPADQYSPPTETRTWFHVGPVGPEFGGWTELDLSSEYWIGDTAMLGPGDRSAIPADLERRRLRDVTRCLRGRVLRSELYARDGTDRQNLPYTVSEQRHDLVPVLDPPPGQADGASVDDYWRQQPVVAVYASGSRTSQWERGNDPLTTATVTGRYDTYGNPGISVAVAAPRGRDLRLPAASGEPALATATETKHAIRDDDTHYLCDRPAEQRRHEIINDGSLTLTELTQAALAGTIPRRLLGFDRTFYDGDAFTGLPAGQLGDHGLPTANATLALTRGILSATQDPAAPPPYLDSPDTRPATGLYASYYRDDTLTDLALTRPDAAIDFSWLGGPDPALCQPTFTARWSGKLHPTYSETYTLSAAGTGGIRLWIDQQPLIDDWPGTQPDHTATVPLQVGTAHDLIVEYHATSFDARLTLAWSSPSQPAQTIPETQLTPPADRTPPSWSPDYPAEFQTTVPPGAGYHYQPGGDGVYEPGYYAISGTRYDIHDTPATGRGLVTAQRDPLGHTATISYDAHQLRPVLVTDPLELTWHAAYDDRTLQLILLTDANGNQTQAGYTPLGLPAWTAATGKDSASQGDTVEQPGTRYDYDLNAYDASLPGERQPAWVRTTRRVDHRWTIIDRENVARAAAGQPPLTPAEIAERFPANETALYPDRFEITQQYTDGLGRELQTRTSADAIILDTLGLTSDQAAAGAGAGPAQAHQADPNTVPVLVSGWKLYDNKARVIKAWEPFYATGWTYQQPDDPTLTDLATETSEYDPRGVELLVIGADKSQQIIVPGVPADLADPSSYVPTPWISHHYDADDNAGRTHPDISQPWRLQWNTPANDMIDPLGRTIARTECITTDATSAAVTTTRYDIDGNPITTTDPLGRTTSTTSYDLIRRSWRHSTLDAGATWAVLDPLGGVVEWRDDKGALTLIAYDKGHRPIMLWATDSTGQPTTLRQVTIHGDDAAAGLTTADAATSNLLGRIYIAYDEAGSLSTPAYDIDANLLTTTRHVLRADLLLSTLPAGPGSWADTGYRVDWQPPAGTALPDYATTLLDSTPYQTDTQYNARARPVTCTLPTDATGLRATARYTYNRHGQLNGTSIDGTDYLSCALYNARGQHELAVLGDGTLVRYLYDQATFRLARLRSESANPTGTLAWSGAANSGQLLQDYGYGYDLVGNLLTLTDRSPGSGLPAGSDPIAPPAQDSLDRSFTYDPLYRLLTASGRETAALPASSPWLDTPSGTDVTKAQAYRETYTYDLAYNILSLTHTSATGYARTYTQRPGTNQLAGVTIGGDTFSYSYDPGGNLTIEADVRRFEWDHNNRLLTFRTQSGSATPSVYAQYRYDGEGQRVVKLTQRPNAAAVVTIYIGGLFERMITSDASSPTAYDTILAPQVAGVTVTLRRGPALPDDQYPEATYRLGDHLNSSTITLDSTGKVLNQEEYTPYGETSFGSYTRKRYRFTAKERDEESGFYYHGARYYAPWQGRWTAADPIGLGDGFNTYAYVHCSPLIHHDPTGMNSAGAKGTLESTGPGWTEVLDPGGKDRPAYVVIHLSGYPPSVKKERPPGTNPDGSTDWGWVAKETIRQLNTSATHEQRVEQVNAALARNADSLKRAGLPTNNGEQMLNAWGGLGETLGAWMGGKLFGPIIAGVFVPKPAPGVRSVVLPTTALPPQDPALALPPGRGPRLPGPTVDRVTGEPVRMFYVDPRGNVMIEPVGGSMSDFPPGSGKPDTHTFYPNRSNYQRLNPVGHANNATPHGHAHMQGTGLGMKGQGPSLSPHGRIVPWNSAEAHWPVK